MVGSGKHDIVEDGLKECIIAFTKECIVPPSDHPRLVVPGRSAETFRSPLYCTRLSAIRSAVSRDDEKKVMRVEVPECLMGTSQGVALVQRLLADDWISIARTFSTLIGCVRRRAASSSESSVACV